MPVVEVNVGIAADLSDDACLAFIDAETGFKHGLVLLIFFINKDTIVAAQSESYLLRRDAKPIVRIDLCGIETLLKVLDELVVQAFEEVAFEDVVGHVPIPIAMVDVVAVALVVVAHLVPLDIDILTPTECEIRRQGGVIVDGQGQGLDVSVEDLLGLREKVNG